MEKNVEQNTEKKTKKIVRNLNKTYYMRENEIDKQWYIVDAENLILGRLATKIATILRGRHKPEYTPNLDMGDFVIVINADKIKVSGRKEEEKFYRWHSMYHGGLKTRTFTEMMKRHPERIIEQAVKGMLPKNKLANRQIRHMKVYVGNDHPHAAQKPQVLTLS